MDQGMTATLKYRSAGRRSSAVYSINQRSFKEHAEKGPPSDGAGESRPRGHTQEAELVAESSKIIGSADTCEIIAITR